MAGREPDFDIGRPSVDLLNANEVCGLEPYADFGRRPGPTLLEKLLLDVCRDKVEGCRDDIEEVSEGLRILLPFAAPTSVVPFTVGLELTETAAIEFGSPALWANVFRLGSGSLYVATNLCFTEVGGAIFEVNVRTLACESDISASSFPGEVKRLGRGSWDGRVLEFPSV